MNRITLLILLAAGMLILGCGGDAVSQPPVLDAQTRDAISQEDAAINDAEEQR